MSNPQGASFRCPSSTQKTSVIITTKGGGADARGHDSTSHTRLTRVTTHQNFSATSQLENISFNRTRTTTYIRFSFLLYPSDNDTSNGPHSFRRNVRIEHDRGGRRNKCRTEKVFASATLVTADGAARASLSRGGGGGGCRVRDKPLPPRDLVCDCEQLRGMRCFEKGERGVEWLVRTDYPSQWRAQCC